MKLRFSIHYRAEWGQQLLVALKYHSADGSARTATLPLTTQDGDHWQGETSVVASRRSPVVSFSYVYKVVDGDGKELRREWDLLDRQYCFDSSKTYVLNDQWRDRPLSFHLYTNAYAVTSHLPGLEAAPPAHMPLYRKTIMFCVSAPQLQAGQQVALLGSHPSVGAWSPARYLLMENTCGREWMITLNADVLGDGMEYKYVVVDEQSRQLLFWEEGDNRVITDMPADGEILVEHGHQLRLAEHAWRVAGVAVPVFSLRSEHSFGVGDFGDLYRLVDWAASTGMKVVQLLPVGDTTATRQWYDSYPYNIVSAFALHPHYMDLEQLGTLADKQIMANFCRRKDELNALECCDYEAVDKVKLDYLQAFFKEQGKDTLTSEDYRRWTEANDYWLPDYVKWHVDHVPSAGDSSFVGFVQYHLHLQLKRAADHARSLGIVLKGDLPIGIGAHSVETALHPSFFHLDASTGALPDPLNINGQNWGFPTFNWEAEGLHEWFRQRLHHLEQYFDALRIDHVLGFFRIWQIPASQVSATMGHFSPALPFTADDIEYFGLPFRRDFLTSPFINDRTIDRFFGIHAQYVREHYLVEKGYGFYDLKDEVDTQLKVKELFDGHTDENSIWIRDGLYRLVSNVLFLEDPYREGTFHPRVLAYQEPVFEALSASERDAYLRLYNNYFFQRHSMFWGRRGRRLLASLFGHTRMLLCAEDLGPLPDCVAPVLDALRMLTLEVQSLPKLAGQEFSHLSANPVRSVATISTHDMAPLRLWWQDHPGRAQRFYTTMLQKEGVAPAQLTPVLAEEIVARHLYSPSMLCILQLQDWLSMDEALRSDDPHQERINEPGSVRSQWQWRMYITLEQLAQATAFNEKLSTMMQRSKRNTD